MNFVQWTTTAEALLCAAVIGILGVILILVSIAVASTDSERTDAYASAVGFEMIAISLMLISMCASASDDTLGAVIMAVMALMVAGGGLLVVFATERHHV